MARCSFDIHVQEILGSLMIGGTLIMLRPKGNIEFEYLSMVMQTKEITFFYTVPTLLHSFFSFVQETQKSDCVKYLRSLCTGGKCK
jgi:acyl-coenzyme A synthetase/AMP-(fatty) acid ligase